MSDPEERPKEEPPEAPPEETAAAADEPGEDRSAPEDGGSAPAAEGEEAASVPSEDASESEASEETPASEDEPAPPAAELPDLVALVEAVLFAAPEPVNRGAFQKICGEDVPWESIEGALKELGRLCEGPQRGVRLEEVAGGWQLLTRSEFFPWVRRTGRESREEKLSPAALETLSIVAYKQPVTRAEVDAVRGVGSGTQIRMLMDRRLVKVTGHAPTPGSPFQYGTTKRFLEHFGLRSLKDLPDPRQAARLLADHDRGRSNA